jgi:hypothetical protein
MKLPKPGEGGGNMEPVPAGTYVGICYRFVDLGTQKSEYQGQIKHTRKVMISWILPDELMSDGRPFSAHKQYGWSMHEKATLRHDLESWRGKAFTPEDFGKFDTKNLLGQPCMLTITQDTKPDGRVFSNVSSVGKPMKGLVIPKLAEPTVYLSLEPDAFDQAVYDSLGNGLKERIAQSPEFKELSAKHLHAAYTDDGLSAGADPSDDIPF